MRNLLRKWLGIDELESDLRIKINNLETKYIDLYARYKLAEARLDNLGLELQEHDHEPEPEPIFPVLWDRKAPQEEWPFKIADIRVGYVKVNADKSPLYMLNKDGVPVVYENPLLRPGNNTTDGKRIIAKSPNWFAVVYNGDSYGFGNPRPFGTSIDGDDLYYKVMHEQMIDGIVLVDWNLPELYLLFRDVIETFEPGE